MGVTGCRMVVGNEVQGTSSIKLVPILDVGCQTLRKHLVTGRPATSA